jgi:hypothetical protein
VDDASTGHEDRLDPHDVGPAPVDQRFDSGGEHLAGHGEVVDHLGPADGQHAPSRAIRQLVVVHLERDDRALCGGRHLGARRSPEHDRTVDQPIVDREDRRERTDGHPDASHLGCGQQTASLLLGQQLETLVHDHEPTVQDARPAGLGPMVPTRLHQPVAIPGREPGVREDQRL